MEAFAIDWDARRVTCPVGIHSSGWTPAVDNRGTPVIKGKRGFRTLLGGA
jgi:hypothetical protein